MQDLNESSFSSSLFSTVMLKSGSLANLMRKLRLPHANGSFRLGKNFVISFGIGLSDFKSWRYDLVIVVDSLPSPLKINVSFLSHQHFRNFLGFLVSSAL